jgi:para-nitrobenzyl esterase
MAGSTSHDMAPPVLQMLTRKWIAKREKPSYTWFFDRMLPGDNCGAWHSADLWYWFGTLPNCWRPMEQKDYDLSDQMTGYLTNFAKTGDPNGNGLTAWEPAGKGTLHIGEGDAGVRRVNQLKLWYNLFANKSVGE